MMERELVQEYSTARKALDDAKDVKKTAQAAFDKIEQEILEHLEGKQATSTAKYEGLGYVQIQKPRLYASCTQDNMPELLDHLKAVEREDLIRTTVMPQTLSTYITELIESGQEVPGQVTYYLKPSIRMYTP